MEEFAVWTEFHYQIIVINVLQKISHGNNTGMAKATRDSHFHLKSRKKSSMDEERFGNNLAGIEDVVVDVITKLDNGKRTLPDRPTKFVGTNP
jgi:hypothetical protein